MPGKLGIVQPKMYITKNSLYTPKGKYEIRNQGTYYRFNVLDL